MISSYHKMSEQERERERESTRGTHIIENGEFLLREVRARSTLFPALLFILSVYLYFIYLTVATLAAVPISLARKLFVVRAIVIKVFIIKCVGWIYLSFRSYDAIVCVCVYDCIWVCRNLPLAVMTQHDKHARF